MVNEKRLIDANALKTAIRSESWIRKQIVHLTLEYINLMIDEQPTVDAVKVVRCKDCAVPHNKWTGCPKLSGLVPPPDFYCAYGERKDNE